MSASSDEENFKVIKKKTEENYSFIPEEKDPPDGWEFGRFVGSMDDCLSHIKDKLQEEAKRKLEASQPPKDSGAAANNG